MIKLTKENWHHCDSCGHQGVIKIRVHRGADTPIELLLCQECIDILAELIVVLTNSKYIEEVGQ